MEYDFSEIVGNSKAIKDVLEVVKRVCRSRSTVIITGETGTGKELIARAIHMNSPRKDKPFIAVDCSALPETLMESELFGHEKGAFTDALKLRRGRFELANGGTILLDEIGDLRASTQMKLLRFLQEMQFERLGGEERITVDVRVLVATNKDLRRAIEEGRFRHDLYYRLSVVTVAIPPLRERRDDVPLLADHFLQEYSKENNKKIKGFSKEAMDMLISSRWNGNVRELENSVERAVVLADQDVLRPEDLFPAAPVRKEVRPEVLKGSSPLTTEAKLSEILRDGVSLKELLDAVRKVEKEYIASVLQQSGWNRGKAAKLLGIPRTTLQEKIKRVGLKEHKPKT